MRDEITDMQLNRFQRNDAEKSIMFIKTILRSEASDEKLLFSDLFTFWRLSDESFVMANSNETKPLSSLVFTLFTIGSVLFYNRIQTAFDNWLEKKKPAKKIVYHKFTDGWATANRFIKRVIYK